ncbi:hypothetical protein GJAV_G00062290 [Gymnothorax javanicus]|nr:hypothetical protein GJAV_G00062290 [Gymnothorax javanicus]
MTRFKGTQFELKDTPGAQHPGFAHHPPTFYPYGQYQFGDPSRPKNATRESVHLVCQCEEKVKEGEQDVLDPPKPNGRRREHLQM